MSSVSSPHSPTGGKARDLAARLRGWGGGGGWAGGGTKIRKKKNILRQWHDAK